MPLRILLPFFLFISSCSSIEVLGTDGQRSIGSEMAHQEQVNVIDSSTDELVSSEVDHELSEMELDRAEVRRDKNIDTDLPLEYHSNLYNFWHNYFTKRDIERFQRHLRNGEEYRPLIKAIFKEYGLPEDLFYVGLIESGFNMHIRSHAAAVGPWQFIAGTATRYGMRVESQVDERRNIVKSTHAAAKYFRDLYNIFGSWELALCAYNAGEYRVINAIRRGKTRSYKELVDQKLLPRETIYYVPKVAAARDISKNRQRYGISIPQRGNPLFKDVEIVEVQRNFTLNEVSRVLNIDLETLRTLNSDYLWQQMTANTRRPMQLVVPSRLKNQVAQNFSAGTRTAYTEVAATSTNAPRTYRVQRGDHLIGISRRFGVTVAEIKRLNNLTSNRILAGQNLIISPQGTETTAQASTNYTVKRGDSLIAIARQFNVTVEELRSANNLRGSRILIGQRLNIPTSGHRVYVVRRGDNLSQIARRFNTSINALVQTNQLRSNTIHPGQRLRVPGS